MDSIDINCPWCKRHVALYGIALCFDKHINETFTKELKIPVSHETENGEWHLGACPYCKNCVLVKFDGQDMHIFPRPLPSETSEEIKDSIRKDIDESKLCFSVGAYRACAVMCRRAIQQACIDKGAKNDSLEKQIDQLESKGVITTQMKDWAHSSRFLGNNAAHPDNPEVSKGDAENILNLAEQMMKILYVMDKLSQKVNQVHKKK